MIGETLVHRNGREAFPRMLDAIEHARTRVRIEIYWWGADPVGASFRRAVESAARRGVDVSVVVDGFGSAALPADYFATLRTCGGRARTFRPLGLQALASGPRGVLGRSHRKILVVDDRSFVGGLNLALPWAPIADGGDDWRDTALELTSQEVADRLSLLVDDSSKVAEGWHPHRGSGLVWLRPEIGVVTNSPTAPKGRAIRAAYLTALKEARSTVDLTSAYFAPRPIFLAHLVRAVRRGVRVRLLVPLRSDVELARVVAMPLLRWLVARGVRVYRFGGGVLHAKTAVFDRTTSIIGSHNLDGLSWAWNLECNLIARSAAVGQRLTKLFEEDLCLSVELPAREPASDFLEALVPDRLRAWYVRGR